MGAGGEEGEKGKNIVFRRDGSMEKVGGKCQLHMAAGVSGIVIVNEKSFDLKEGI